MKKTLTLSERAEIINKIKLTASINDITDILKTTGAMDIFEQYIRDGKTVDTEIPIPEQRRTLIIRLHNTVVPRPLVNLHVWGSRKF